MVKRGNSRSRFGVKSRFLALAALCLSVVLTLPLSAAKLIARQEYTLKLAMVEHFTFAPGDVHTFAIPYSGYYAFQLRGGDGGDSGKSGMGGDAVYRFGGSGGMVIAVGFFPQGTVLDIVVGSKGDINHGGFNGGGNGGTDNSSLFNYYAGGGGGGATDVRLSGGTLDDRILVAGGGGGGSGGSADYAAVRGGSGGAHDGNYAGTNGSGAGGGQGGGPEEGGEGYIHGEAGIGGSAQYSGGGGGGGYYGGGGSYGSGGGGGGGSAYIADSLATGVPAGLPGIADYMPDERDGYAMVSFLGSRYGQGALPGRPAGVRYDAAPPIPEAEKVEEEKREAIAEAEIEEGIKEIEEIEENPDNEKDPAADAEADVATPSEVLPTAGHAA